MQFHYRTDQANITPQNCNFYFPDLHFPLSQVRAITMNFMFQSPHILHERWPLFLSVTTWVTTQNLEQCVH